MREYAKLLGLIIAVERAGFRVQNQLDRTSSRPISQPEALLSQPNPLTDIEFTLAGNAAKTILNEAAEMDDIRNQAAYSTAVYMPRRFGDGREVAAVVLQWGREPLPEPITLRHPYHGDDNGTYFGISIEIDPKNASISILRRAAPDVLRLHEGGPWLARAFIQQPMILLPPVARALNATLNRGNQDR